MKKSFVSIATAVMLLPFISGFKTYNSQNDSLCLFPELTFSNAVTFNNPDKKDDKLTVCEKNDEVKVKFKIIEWLMSVFED